MRCSPAVKKATRVVLHRWQELALPAPRKRAHCQTSMAAVTSSRGTVRATGRCMSACAARLTAQDFHPKAGYLPWDTSLGLHAEIYTD